MITHREALCIISWHFINADSVNEVRALDAVPHPGTAELGPCLEIITWPALCCLRVVLHKVSPGQAASVLLLLVRLV